jgi:hypothetical protein
VPIPPFDPNHVLPPHVGDPRHRIDTSPYACTIDEFCTRFNTSAERAAILTGLLDLRRALFGLGASGFQWLGGSFVEDAEVTLGRPPADIDVVTFLAVPGTPTGVISMLMTRPDLYRAELSLRHYRADHAAISLGEDGDKLVRFTHYWYGLLSHRRGGVWKGICRVDLVDEAADAGARAALEVSP